VLLAEALTQYEVADTGCWEWTRGKGSDGYGRAVIAEVGKQRLAHRVFYEHHVDKIPTGLVIDHLCRNRGCVNPEHLEPVTHQVNLSRGELGFALTGKCRSGRHEIKSDADVKVHANRRRRHPSRQCRHCLREYWLANKKTAVGGVCHPTGQHGP
jgi:hypothetical protein